MPKKAKRTVKKSKATTKKKTLKAKVSKAVRKAPAKKAAPAKASRAKGTAPAKAEIQAPPPIAMNGEVREGAMALDFALPDSYGKVHKLSNYRGRKVVIYFYPKDNTPGCTIEACDFRDKNGAINSAGATTFGVSPDNGDSHRKFITKYNLGFTLLCDADKEVAKRYGVWKEKSNYGQTYWGIERTTFLIDEEGRIRKIFPKVQVQGHVEQVLEALKAPAAAKRAEPALHGAK